MTEKSDISGKDFPLASEDILQRAHAVGEEIRNRVNRLLGPGEKEPVDPGQMRTNSSNPSNEAGSA